MSAVHVVCYYYLAAYSRVRRKRSTPTENGLSLF